ncbi:MAG TPA: sigma-70 family RNA polymerase sigma factor [Myxococcota bacterium]|nr:sigma-70 family RNA polymerase sigma factor [Myxococcota bacterium]
MAAAAYRRLDPCGESRPPLRLVWDDGLERRAASLFEEFRVHERPETFRSLFETAGPALLPLVRMKVRRQRGRVDPAELLTDTFAQIYKHRSSFQDRGPGSFVRWFLAIADNLMRQETRETTRRARREQLVARSIEDREADPVARLLADEALLVARMTYGQLRALVLEGMRKLPARQEQVLLLHTQERLSYREIAARLGIKQGAVSMRIRRARLRILEHVRERIGA